MIEINMLEAKTNLTKLIKLLETKQEDEIIICRNGEPCAKLISYNKQLNKRIVGRFEGKYKEIDWEAFDKMDNEIVKDIYSSEVIF